MSESRKVAIRREYSRAMEGLRLLLAKGGQHDIAEFTARGYASDAVDVLAAMMYDPTLKPELRRQCALDILTRAYGQPLQPVRVDYTPPLPAAGVNDPITIEMDNARSQAEAQAELLRWLKVPRKDWPAEVVAKYGQEAAILEQAASGPAHEVRPVAGDLSAGFRAP